MKELCVTLSVEIPADPFEAAAIYGKLQPSWGTLLEALKASGTKYDLKFSERQRRVRKRKPRLVAPPDAAA